MVESECWSHIAFWVGLKELNTVTNEDGTTSEGEIKTIFDRIPDWRVSNWDQRFDKEPNDKKGDEQCIRLKDGLVNDALCTLNRTCAKKYGIGMGYICENHNYYERACEEPAEESDFVPPKGAEYSIAFGEDVGGKDWAFARAECQAKGTGWDLAVPNSPSEMDFFRDMIGCSPGGYWTGMRWTPDSSAPSWDTPGSIETVDGTIPYVRWDTHTHWDKPNPNTNNGNTECLRIRGDKIVDSKCDRTHGPKRRPYPQPYGWICELTPPSEPAPECVPTGETPSDDYPAHYKFFANQGTDFESSRKICQSLGGAWDIAIVNSKGEYEYFWQSIDAQGWCGNAWWMGYQSDGTEEARTMYGRLPDWYLKWADGQPTGSQAS